VTLAALAAAAAIASTQASAIDALVEKTMAAEHIEGATVAVAVRGKVAYEKGFGFADVGTKKPAAADTVYPIGSISKQFTAACVLLLLEQKKLSLDDPVSRYVSGLPWGDRVTLRHLLDQESGIVDFRAGATDVTTPLPRGDAVARLSKTDLLFAPGSQYAYSNSNYYLLGMVVEKVTGRPYEDFLASAVLKRLGLASTVYNDGPLAARMASGYVVNGGSATAVKPENPDWAYAAGALASTAGDLIKWDESLAAPGFLDAASLDDMFTPGTLDDGEATDYAFGWVAVKHDDRRLVWHNGEVTGYHAMNATFPDDRTDVVVLTNTGGTSVADRLAIRIFDLLHPFVPSTADKAAAARVSEWLGRIERGDIDRTQLADALSAAITPDVVRSTGVQLKALGALKSIEETAVDEDASGRSYGFDLAFAKRTIHWIMGIDATGKISALSIGF
jgi:D-alanyl-D-alanine carboxypeptidase